MSVVGMMMAVALSGPAPIEPVLWLHPRGDLLLNGKKIAGNLTKGAATVRTPFGLGLDLDGTNGGLLLGDLPPLALARSITVSTWVYLRRYVTGDLGSQIFFRGDDRPGLDPYYMRVLGDGTVQFVVEQADGLGAEARGEVPVGQWVHLTGSFDAEAHELRLWVGDRLVSTRLTDRSPFVELDRGAWPGVGIGNVQHQYDNEALDGTLADLRVYAAALEPREAGYRSPRP